MTFKRALYDLRRVIVFMVIAQVAIYAMYATAVHADIVTLQWDHSTSETREGYRLFQAIAVVDENGTVTHEYDYTQPVTGEGYLEGNINKDQNSLMLDLEGSPNAETTYYWVMRAFVGDNESLDSNEVTVTIDNVIPPLPGQLDGSFNKIDSNLSLSWTQEEMDQVKFWKVFYRIEGTDDLVELGMVQNEEGGELKISQAFDAVPDGELKVVHFAVVAYKKDSVFSGYSMEFPITVDRLPPLEPPQNLRVELSIPVV